MAGITGTVLLRVVCHFGSVIWMVTLSSYWDCWVSLVFPALFVESSSCWLDSSCFLERNACQGMIFYWGWGSCWSPLGG